MSRETLPTITCKHFRYYFPWVFRCLLLSLFLILSHAGVSFGETVAQQLDARLKAHGDYLVTTAPAEVKNGSQLVKAKYIFKEYCIFLNGQRQGVNSFGHTQLLNARNGDRSMLQCGWHTEKLKILMGRMGIRSEDMSGIVADAHSSLPYLLSPNQEHGALALRDKDGKVYVFDAWQLAVNNVIVSTGINLGAYSGAENSKWNGMEAQLWDKEMRSQGYLRFNDPTMMDTNYALDLQTVLNRIFGIDQPTGGWAGKWYSGKFMELFLEQTGTKVTGEFKDNSFGGLRTGIVTGNVDEKTPSILVGNIRINPYLVGETTEPGYERPIRWTLEKNGKRFYCEWGSAGIWDMTRTKE